MACSRGMLLLAVLLSTWAAAGFGAPAPDRAMPRQITAPSGPATPVWLEGPPRTPAAGASRGPRLVGGPDGHTPAVIVEALACRVGAPRAGTGLGDGAGWREAGPLTDRARDPPLG